MALQLSVLFQYIKGPFSVDIYPEYQFASLEDLDRYIRGTIAQLHRPDLLTPPHERLFFFHRGLRAAVEDITALQPGDIVIATADREWLRHWMLSDSTGVVCGEMVESGLFHAENEAVKRKLLFQRTCLFGLLSLRSCVYRSSASFRFCVR